MAEAVFLIDLASARPPQPPSTQLWPAVAREHCNQLKRCMHRIVTHSETKSVTTHIFDSTVIAQSGSPTTNSPEEALKHLDRLFEQVIKLDVTGLKHPAARGIVAGISDGAPEDRFSDYYGNSTPNRDIYVFGRAPSTKLALAAFLGDEEFDMQALEQKLKSSPYLPNELRRLAKQGDRVVWINSTPRRCEQKDDVDHEAEQVFSNWLLSYSSKFRFLNLQSFLLDRRIVPAKAMLRSLSDDFSSTHLSTGKEVEVLCLEDSHLLRCFQGKISRFQVPVCETESSKLLLVLSGIVRNYDTNELTALGAFNTPVCLITPSFTPSLEDSRRPCPASIFAGLMVDLARQNRCLVADLLEVDEGKESFVRYQTLLEPVTPVTAVLRRISRIISAVNYSAPSLPESFGDWVTWDALGKIKDCEMADSAIQASPKFFETYLPTLFSSRGKESYADQKAANITDVPKGLANLRTERMLMSFEDSTLLPTDTQQHALVALVEGIHMSSLTSFDKALGNNDTKRGLIIEKLRSQLKAEQKRNPQASPKPSSSNQHLSRQGSRRQGSPKSTHTFKWRSGSSKTIAPQPKDIQRCMKAHMQDKKREQTDYTCTNAPKADMDEAPGLPNLARSDLATDRTRRSAIQNTTEATASHHTPSQEAITSDVLRNTGEATSGSVKLVNEIASNAPSKEPVRHKLGTHSQGSPCAKQKRKAEVLAPGEDQAWKRHQPANLKSTTKERDQDTECEKLHRRDIRKSIAQFSVAMNKLREGNSRTLEEILWKCIDHLSALAAALSKNHRERCDIDRIINLNLKIPQAVTAAVQEVQNKAKRDDISSKTVLVETWETIMYAFEQCVWHLASSRRTALNEEGKTEFRRPVRQVSTILTCTQFMAEMAANSRPQPVSFRCMFSKLFSSVFVHLGLLKSGKPFSQILNLFEKFEEPLPTSLRVQSSLTTGEKVVIGKKQQVHPKSPEILHQSSNDQRPRGTVEQVDNSKQFGANEKSASVSAAKERKLAKSGPITKMLHSGNRTFGLGRPQFAKESEILRNAMMSQTRLPVKSSKKSLNQSSSLTERKRSTRIDDLGSSLQAILANTVPAPVIDDPAHVFDNTLEKAHPSARSPSKANRTQHSEWAAQCVIADDTAVDTSGSKRHRAGMPQLTPKQTRGDKSSYRDIRDLVTSPVEHSDVADNSDPENDVRSPTAHLGDQSNLVPTEVFPDSAEKQDSKPRPILTSADVGPNQDISPPVSAILVEVSNLQTRAVDLSESRHDGVDDFPATDPAHTSSVEIAACEKGRQRRKETREEKRQVVERSAVGYSTRSVTRSTANQNVAKLIESDISLEPSHEAQRRVTRSQAKQTSQKRRLVTAERQGGGHRGSSNRKRRRTKSLCTDPNAQSDEQNISDCESPPKSSSPMTRSQAKAIAANGSIQLRNRSVSCPTPRLAVELEVRRVSADSGTPLKSRIAPKSRKLGVSSFEHTILTPETPCVKAQKDAVIPQTPRAYNSRNGDSSVIRQIAESSLERRRKQLEHVEYIPETPVAPTPSKTKYPRRDSVKRKLFEKVKLHE